MRGRDVSKHGDVTPRRIFRSFGYILSSLLLFSFSFVRTDGRCYELLNLGRACSVISKDLRKNWIHKWHHNLPIQVLKLRQTRSHISPHSHQLQRAMSNLIMDTRLRIWVDHLVDM